MHQAVSDDRLWFQGNPVAIVRFRNAIPGEFTPFVSMGENPPFFRPSVCRPRAPLRWVAVVDLMRLAGSSLANSEKASARIRLQIPAIRSLRGQEKAKAELLNAVSAELLEYLEPDQSVIAA